MLPNPRLAADPLAPIDATLHFVAQLLIGRHPDMLLPPEEAPLDVAPTLLAARELLAAIRDLHEALETYRASMHDHRDQPSS